MVPVSPNFHNTLAFPATVFHDCNSRNLSGISVLHMTKHRFLHMLQHKSLFLVCACTQQFSLYYYAVIVVYIFLAVVPTVALKYLMLLICSIFHALIRSIIRGGADKSLARPGRKQATATKHGIYSTYSPRSSIHFLAHCSIFCKPLKKNSEDCPSNQVSTAAMTSTSDKKWPFNCFFSPGNRW